MKRGICCARTLWLVVALMIATAPTQAAVAYVASSASSLGSSSVGSVSMSAPAGLVSGHVMVAFVAQNTGSLPIIGSAPAGWTSVLARDDGSAIGMAVYYRIATGSDVAGTTSYTWTFQNSARSGGLIMAFSGVSSSTPIVISGSQANSSSATYTAPSVTPGVANTMLVAMYAANNGGGGMNIPAGTTSAFVGATGAGPNGILIGGFYDLLVSSTATGTIQSTGNSAAKNLGATLALQPATLAPNHLAISHSGTGVNCQPEPVMITAHTSAHVALATTDSIVLSTSTGHGDWSLTTGSGAFVAGASNSGSATYTYTASDNGVAVFALRDTYAETLSISVTDGVISESSGSALGSEDSALTFAASGFRITNGSNVATSIGTRIAGLSSASGAGAQSLAVQAIRTDTSTGACTTAFASGTTVNVSLAYQCNNPTSCVAGQNLAVTNNGTTTTIASNPNSGVSTYTTVPLRFSTANAEAPISLNYSDAGQVTLHARYTIPLGSGAASSNIMLGSSQFVVQPSTLTLTNIKCTTYAAGGCSLSLASPGNNPAAATASGTVFMPAGASITATVTATNALGAVTPNFGQEISPASVQLVPVLILPATGHLPAVSGSFGSYTSGVATGTSFAWPEVGIIKLTPTVSSYLASGTVTGTTTGNVGRFVPSTFSIALNAPIIGTACIAGSYSYIGQPLSYTVAPVITATALAVGGATTQNYIGTLMRLSNSSLTGRTYTPTPASPALDTSGLPATTADPAIADLGGGHVALTFSTGTGLMYTRGAALAPFNANIALSINVIDLDSVAASNPVSFGSGTGLAFSTGTTQRYGRVALRNGVGSELLDLPLRLVSEYYASAALGFTINTGDSCTVAPAIAFSAFQGSLASGETCVRDSGTPGVSTAGCAAAAGASVRYRATPLAGDFNLTLAAPGSGNTGALTVTATAPAWLRYDWNTGTAGLENPSGLASFGRFPGPTSRIYQREIY